MRMRICESQANTLYAGTVIVGTPGNSALIRDLKLSRELNAAAADGRNNVSTKPL